MKLLTNNPAFKKYKNKKIKVEYINTDYEEILKKARDYIHNNYEILTHPLYGSIKPNETLYRSIVLVKRKNIDNNSVILISSAIETFEKFRKNKKTLIWTENIKNDFSMIDYDLIENAIQRFLE